MTDRLENDKFYRYCTYIPSRSSTSAWCWAPLFRRKPQWLLGFDGALSRRASGVALSVGAWRHVGIQHRLKWGTAGFAGAVAQITLAQTCTRALLHRAQPWPSSESTPEDGVGAVRRDVGVPARSVIGGFARSATVHLRRPGSSAPKISPGTSHDVSAFNDITAQLRRLSVSVVLWGGLIAVAVPNV